MNKIKLFFCTTKNAVLKLIVFAFLFFLSLTCIGTNKDTVSYRSLQNKLIYTSNNVGFMDSGSTTEYMYYANAEVDIMQRENKIHLRVDSVSGDFTIITKTVKTTDGESMQIYSINDKDVKYVIINGEIDIFFVRKNGARMVINKCDFVLQ